MPSLKKIDLPARLAAVMPLWLAELITALICLAATGLLRFVVDALTPGVAPFVLLFPAALVATLIGGWRTGALVFAVSELWAWYYVIPPRGLAFKGEAEPANLVVIAVAGGVMIATAQAFRFGARREADARRAELADRDLMLRELEHRMKNNFQTVASLIQLQLRRADGAQDPGHDAALEFAQFVGGADEEGGDRADPAAHGVGRDQLHQGLANEDRQHVRRPQHRQRRDRQPERPGQGEDNGRDAIDRDPAEQGQAGAVADGPPRQDQRHHRRAQRRSGA